MIVYIYNIAVDLYNGFNGLRHRINWTYFTVLDGLAHPLYSLFADVIQNEFKNAEIKIAGLNVWDKSKNIIHTDFALYENTVIKAPMSKDSSEYKEFVRIYNRETKEGTL